MMSRNRMFPLCKSIVTIMAFTTSLSGSNIISYDLDTRDGLLMALETQKTGLNSRAAQGFDAIRQLLNDRKPLQISEAIQRFASLKGEIPGILNHINRLKSEDKITGNNVGEIIKILRAAQSLNLGELMKAIDIINKLKTLP